MKRLFIILSVLTISFSCERDEIPVNKTEIDGNWSLVDISAITINDSYDSVNFVYNNDTLNTLSLSGYNNTVNFKEEGIYVYNDNDADQLIFCASSDNYSDTNWNQSYGLYNMHLNSYLNNIIHFDPFTYDDSDLYGEVNIYGDTMSITFDFDESKYFEDIAIGSYYAISNADYLMYDAVTANDAYNTGYHYGYFEGYYDYYAGWTDNFYYLYGSNYVETMNSYLDENLMEPGAYNGYVSGYNDAYNIGAAQAQSESNYDNPDFSITYKFVKQ